MKKIILSIGLALIAQVSFAQECKTTMIKTAPNTRFIEQTSGTVKDLHTGLTWMRCPLGMLWNNADNICTGKRQGFTWQAALTEANDINDPTLGHALHKFAGITTWRLPNIKELVSLTEAACFNPTLNNKAFGSGLNGESGDTSLIVWSNTSVGDGRQVWYYRTRDGLAYPTASLSSTWSVLLVAEQP